MSIFLALCVGVVVGWIARSLFAPDLPDDPNTDPLYI